MGVRKRQNGGKNLSALRGESTTLSNQGGTKAVTRQSQQKVALLQRGDQLWEHGAEVATPG